jgi:antitoxin component YwqK of YwqJK toxin-antitoxin module
MKYGLFVLFTCFSLPSLAQDPPYTKKHFVREYDTTEFKGSGPVKNGAVKTYLNATVTFHDVDDNNTTHVRGTQPVLLYIEGQIKNDKKNGISRHYLIDSLDHSKRFLIDEQTYKDDKLNGVWNVYNLKGTRVATYNFKDDSLHGIYRQYWIDGISIMEEMEYFDGKGKFIKRSYFKNGKVSEEFLVVNGKQTGEIKAYYETGVLKEKFNAKDGSSEGLRIYYYPDGKPWIETIFKDDKPWTLVANYDSKGNKRNAGTLKDGNGTIIYYDDDTTVREVITYINGEEKK